MTMLMLWWKKNVCFSGLWWPTHESINMIIMDFRIFSGRCGFTRLSWGFLTHAAILEITNLENLENLGNFSQWHPKYENMALLTFVWLGVLSRNYCWSLLNAFKERKPFQFWRKIWIHPLIILLQLYLRYTKKCLGLWLRGFSWSVTFEKAEILPWLFTFSLIVSCQTSWTWYHPGDKHFSFAGVQKSGAKGRVPIL